MRSMAVKVLGALLAAGPLAGCGDNGAGPDAGVDAGPPPVEYFSLQVGRCFEYTTAATAQPSPDLGVVVEEIDQSTTPPTYVISYTTSRVAMHDYVTLEGNAMLLSKRVFHGGNTYIYDPPMRRLTAPLRGGDALQFSSPVTIYDATGAKLADQESHSLRVDVFEPETLRLPLGFDVEAMKLSFSETPSVGRTELRSFVPGDGSRDGADGFVRIVFNFNIDATHAPLTYTLQNVRDLGDGSADAGPQTPCGFVP